MGQVRFLNHTRGKRRRAEGPGQAGSLPESRVNGGCCHHRLLPGAPMSPAPGGTEEAVLLLLCRARTPAPRVSTGRPRERARKGASGRQASKRGQTEAQARASQDGEDGRGSSWGFAGLRRTDEARLLVYSAWQTVRRAHKLVFLQPSVWTACVGTGPYFRHEDGAPLVVLARAARLGLSAQSWEAQQGQRRPAGPRVFAGRDAEGPTLTSGPNSSAGSACVRTRSLHGL